MKVPFSGFIRQIRCLNVDNSAPLKILNGYVDTVDATYRKRYECNVKLQEQYQSLVGKVREGGGPKSRDRHTNINRKLLVQDRLKLLLDPGSDLLEVGTFAGSDLDYGDIPGAGIVTGIGSVSGYACMILANDATVKGGTIYPIGVKKQLRAQEIAEHLRLPAISLIDSGGAFLPLQAEIFPDQHHGGRVFYNEAVMGSKGIPQVSIVCGSCTAGAAYIPTLADDAIIVDRIGSLFLAGPPLVKAALGEIVTSEQLGGATVHCRTSGCTDYFVANEESAMETCRNVITRLGQVPIPNAVSNAQTLQPKYSSAELVGLADPHGTGRPYIEQILARLLDSSQFLEFRGLYGDNLIAGFGNISGYPIGVVASCGVEFDSRSVEKAAQLVQMASLRGTPLLFLVNTQGDGWSSAQDSGRCGKSISQLISAVSCADVPIITLITGGCFGIQGLAMAGRALSPTFTFAWPTARIGLVSPDQSDRTGWLDAGSESINAEDSRRQLESESSAFYAAARLWVDSVILPQDTRRHLELALHYIHCAQPAFQRSAHKAVMRM